MNFKLLFVLGIITLSSCQSEVEKIIDSNENNTYIEVQDLIQEAYNYLEDRDFDSDGKPDYVAFTYTGGAHCCYQIHIKLSSQADTIHFPFNMDGGYGFGIVDGSNHDQFDIDDYDYDGVVEIFMGINTYNEHKDPISPEHTATYGIKSNYIILDYVDGEIVIMDYNPTRHLTKPRSSGKY